MHSEDVIDDIDFPDGCYVVKIQTIGEPTLPQYQPPQVRSPKPPPLSRR